MNTKFASLPQPLLQHIGLWQSCAPLAQALLHAAPQTGPGRTPEALANYLRRQTASQLPLSLRGLDVLLHRAPAATGPDSADTAEAPEPRWGLFTACWHTGAMTGTTAWAGPWPEGVDPRTVRPEQLVHELARAPDEAVIAPGMVCFEVDGHDGRDWALMGMFDMYSHRLQSLYLSRVGDWVHAPAAPSASQAA